MKADAFLEKVHGQYTRVLERKIALGLLSKAPTSLNAKRAYDGLVYLPITACTSILVALARPIEMLASAAIHLVGAAFAQNKKAELLQAKRFILVRFPLSLLEATFRAITLPLDFIISGIRIAKSPLEFEEKTSRGYNYEDLIAKLEESMKDAQSLKLKNRIQDSIDRLKKNIPVSIFELLTVTLAAKKEYKDAHPEAQKAEKPLKTKEMPQKPADQILWLANKYGIEVSKQTKSQATGLFADANSKKIALKLVIKRLQLALHPDKTIKMPEAEKAKRVEDMQILNQATAGL